MLLNKIVNVKLGANDKYGRTLATVKKDDTDVANLLLEKKYVRAYDGGHKDNWDL
jgi:endonuclease YncB( thermonuclease family)